MAKKDKRKHNGGRPRMPENLKKKALPLKVKPTLLAAINKQTAGKNRNQELETVLERQYLQPLTA